MPARIITKKGMTTLLERYIKAEASEEDILEIVGCINSLETDEPIYMDDDDYKYASKELKKLWKGLK